MMSSDAGIIFFMGYFFGDNIGLIGHIGLIRHIIPIRFITNEEEVVINV